MHLVWRQNLVSDWSRLLQMDLCKVWTNRSFPPDGTHRILLLDNILGSWMCTLQQQLIDLQNQKNQIVNLLQCQTVGDAVRSDPMQDELWKI